MNQRIRAGGQLVEARARHRVACHHHRNVVGSDPESDRRFHRPMIGGGHGDSHPVAVPNQTLGVLLHIDSRRRGQVGVVRDAVADVPAERLERRVDDLCGAGRADDRQRWRVGYERGDPAGDQHVAEIGDVVAMEVRQEQRGQSVGAHPDGRSPLQNAAPAVHQQCLAPGAHQRRGSGPVRIGDGTSGAEQDDLDHVLRYVTAAFRSRGFCFHTASIGPSLV